MMQNLDPECQQDVVYDVKSLEFNVVFESAYFAGKFGLFSVTDIGLNTF